jgi:hypothetical protein
LIGKEGRGPNPRKSAVVPTKSILIAANMPIIGGHHVLALQSPPEAVNTLRPALHPEVVSEALPVH